MTAPTAPVPKYQRPTAAAATPVSPTIEPAPLCKMADRGQITGGGLSAGIVPARASRSC